MIQFPNLNLPRVDKRMSPRVEAGFQMNRQRVVEVGMCVLVFLLPWQTRWIISAGEINGVISEYLTVSFYAVDILLVVLLLLQFFCLRKIFFAEQNFHFIYQFARQKNIIAISTLLFIAWNGVSIFWATNKMLAVQHVSWLFLAAGMAWLISRYRNKYELVFWFLMGLLISAWLGILQFVSQFGHANKWLGLSQHDPMLSGTSIVEFYAGNETVRWLRSYGSFDHPNIFGVMMAVGIILSLWLFARKENKKKEILFLYFMSASFTIGMFASLSRSAWLGLFLALAAIGVKLFVQKSHQNISKSMKPLWLSGIAFLMMVLLYPAQFLMRSGGDGRLEQRSISDRVIFLEQSKDIIEQNWLLGVGSGNYMEALKIGNQAKPDWTFQPVHNTVVLIWSELGIVGVFLSFILLITILRIAWQKTQFGLGLIVVILPSMMLDHWLWSLHFGAILLGISIGFLLNKNDSKS